MQPSQSVAGQSLYQRLLGDYYDALPATIRALHGHSENVTYAGRGSVERGNHWLARVIGAMMRFPPAIADTSVSVHFEIRDGTETWIRQFGTHRFQSCLSARNPILHESFAWIGIDFKLDVDSTGLRMIPTRWAVFGIALPKIFWPTIIGQETEVDGRFQFLVEAIMPLAGLVVRYRGFLERKHATPSS